MVATLGDYLYALSSVKKWAAEFKRVRERLEDDLTTQENIDCVHHMVMDDRRLTVYQIADAFGISRELVENILHKALGILKVSARWVLRLLKPDQKHNRLVVSQVNLAVFGSDRDGFLECLLTLDECWGDYFEAETKRQPMQWKHPSKEGGVVCRENDDLLFLGCKGYCVHWFPLERSYCQRRILCQIAKKT